MSKNIFDEALKHLNILNDFVVSWCDEIDLDYHDTYKNNYQKVKKAIELGKLYKELYYSIKKYTAKNPFEEMSILTKIKELENDK